jgi:serine/threonine protein kinase
LGGRYPLVECVEADQKTARFRTIVANEPANVRIRILEGDESGHELARWQFLKRSPHPNLLTVIDAGRCEVQGVWLEYVVMEHYPENVAEVLVGRCLTGTEAREMLESIVPALVHLHAHGIVHGSLRPAAIVAAGNKIKLEVVESRAAGTNGYTTAGDVLALGATLMQCLNTQPPGPPAILPEPFATIVARCSAESPQDRPTAQGVLALLRGEVLTLPQQIGPEAGPPRVKVPRRPIILAAAGLIACGAALISIVYHRSNQLPSEKGGARSRVSESRDSAPRRTEATSKPPSIPKPTKPGEQPNAWRVIVYTFNRRTDARKRAERINAKWPDLHAEVFSPAEGNAQGKTPYLVSLGGRLTRDEAARIRERAVAHGLPKDAYSQNFTH